MTAGLLVALPVLGGVLLLLVRRPPGVLAAIGLGTLAAELALAVVAAVRSLREPVAAGWSWGPRLALQLDVTGLSRVMIVLVPAIALPVVLYAWASLRREPGLSRLLALLVAFVGAMELLVLAGDFLTLLIGWELVGAVSWALIGHEWREPGSPRAALQAFLTTRAGDLGLYAAAGLTLAAAGSLRLDALAAVPGPALGLIAAGVLLAAAAKSAQLPFAPWLFSAMAGPTPASALLHSATMVAAGAYLLARLSAGFAPVAWFGPVVAGLGLATALAAGLVAMLQADAKRVLAASTSAQYGLMFVAIGAGVPAAAGLHLVAHAAFKALLFLGAGMVIHAAGTGDLRQIHGTGVRPRIALSFGIGILALAAVPPIGGGYTKEQILGAATEPGPAFATALFPAGVLAAGVLVAGALSALYAARLYLLALGPGMRPAAGDTPQLERLGVASLAAVSLVLGLLWLPGAGNAAAALVGGRLAQGASWELPVSLLTIGLAALAAWIAWRRGVLLAFGLAERVRAPIAEWLGIPALAELAIVTPATRLSRALAAFDDRAVDAGIRAAAGLAAGLSRGLGWWGERAVDDAVRGLARLTAFAALRFRLVDDRGVDAAVEGTAVGARKLGGWGRALQSGMSHQYYVIVAIGTVLAVLAALIGR